MKLKIPLGDKGIEIEVIPDEEAEKVDYVVCVRVGTPSPFDDNLTAFCCKCGTKVIHRWHAPRTPPKICLECALEMSEKDAEAGVTRSSKPE
jgi:hypothetical protein